MGARENFAARKLIFVTTSTCTPAKPSTRAKLAAHAAGSTMIDGSRLLTIVIACWERLPVHWQARLVGQEQS